MRIFMRFALRFAAFCLAFSTKMPRVLHQNGLRLAPKCSAFCSILQCVLQHIAVCFAAYCTILCCKQPKSWCKLQFYAMYIHLACINNYPLLAPKQTFAGIDFLRSNGRLVIAKALTMLKFMLKTRQIEVLW